ncbi:multidrug efflux pump subunit AcrA (membrane-fusion protein) [Plasticicumulans lactativorans]|uniref:Multidrug efflux pump subunit AcrA (Membrane-fusion protein) n=1 Tax=Plasticicumulans lactativorans TaxID=1133106 RepID=A0A4R2L2V0_9GAMM|nr:HlyD family efflux transporter periplasmic adaptor subunit [Plasticicumulans lactativorans]TCO80683.1 multidrug efflux pump subunit AcrA (membrane-fusion protein) [Plasticicumulans lactativorans]
MIRLLACLLALLPAPAFAHGGEDHGDGKASAAAAVVAAPRFETASGDFQLVGILDADGHGLTLYLDRYASNEPVAGARLALEADGRPLAVVDTGDGVYRVDDANLAAPGSREIIASIDADGVQDVLLGKLAVVAPAATAPAAGAGAVAGWWSVLGAAAAGLVVGLLLGRLRAPGGAAALAGAALVATAAWQAAPAFAHGGEDHGDGQAVAAPAGAGDAPSRLADASLFVPKPAQRLLGLRTRLTASGDTPRTQVLPGHLLADPNRSGRVQATQEGRIEPVDGAFPHIGQHVEAGEVLAWLVPLAARLETSERQAQLAELDSQIRLAERRLARLQPLAGSVAAGEIDAARTELAGLRERRTAMGSGLAAREALRAPVAGVISHTALVAGQLAEARETLVEIVDPAAWWAEARVFDATLPTRIERAFAETQDGRAFALELRGVGFQRRSQGLPMQFRVVDALAAPAAADARGTAQRLAGLSAGEPLRILVQSREQVRGVRLPRDAVTRGANGEPVVFVQTAAERFVPVRVRFEAVDGVDVVVTSGLAGGERVVTVGAALLAQVR